MRELVDLLIGPRLGKVDLSDSNPDERPALDDGILWVAYDVRCTGIEKHFQNKEHRHVQV